MIKLWEPGKGELPEQVEAQAQAASDEVRKRIGGLPGWEPEIYIGEAELARGAKLLVVLLPIRAQAHREVMALCTDKTQLSAVPDRVYTEALYYVHGQPEPGLVAARRFLGELATQLGGSIAAARFNLALEYVSALGGEGKG